MKPIPSNNSLPASRGDTLVTTEWDFDITFSDAALCGFSDWMDEELLSLEAEFETFITKRSQKGAIGR
jgi:hypothetical protein